MFYTFSDAWFVLFSKKKLFCEYDQLLVLTSGEILTCGVVATLLLVNLLNISLMSTVPLIRILVMIRRSSKHETTAHKVANM